MVKFEEISRLTAWEQHVLNLRTQTHRFFTGKNRTIVCICMYNSALKQKLEQKQSNASNTIEKQGFKKLFIQKRLY